jgi:hypothetical protein
MVIFPHPPYLPYLAPCHSHCFTNSKWNWRVGVYDIQKESQPVLDSIKENYIHGAFEA